MASTVWNIQMMQMNWVFSMVINFTLPHINVDLKVKLLPFRHTWLSCRKHQWTWFCSWPFHDKILTRSLLWNLAVPVIFIQSLWLTSCGERGVAPDWLPMPLKSMQIIHISSHIFCANRLLSRGLTSIWATQKECCSYMN